MGLRTKVKVRRNSRKRSVNFLRKNYRPSKKLKRIKKKSCSCDYCQVSLSTCKILKLKNIEEALKYCKAPQLYSLRSNLTSFFGKNHDL